MEVRLHESKGLHRLSVSAARSTSHYGDVLAKVIPPFWFLLF